MKPVRKLLFFVAAAGIAAIVLRTAINAANDVAHYNRLRAMSGQGPFWEELPEMLREIRRNEKGTPGDLAAVAASLPADAARYLKMKAM